MPKKGENPSSLGISLTPSHPHTLSRRGHPPRLPSHIMANSRVRARISTRPESTWKRESGQWSRDMAAPSPEDVLSADFGNFFQEHSRALFPSSSLMFYWRVSDWNMASEMCIFKQIFSFGVLIFLRFHCIFMWIFFSWFYAISEWFLRVFSRKHVRKKKFFLLFWNFFSQIFLKVFFFTFLQNCIEEIFLFEFFLFSRIYSQNGASSYFPGNVFEKNFFRCSEIFFQIFFSLLFYFFFRI